MPTIAYHTLGCKVNQYETERIREELERAGFETVPFAAMADAYVINTCTVTSVADSKSRAAVRRALKLNPDAFVVVSGCYAELEPTQIADIEGVDLVVSNQEKSAIPERLAARFAPPLTQHSTLNTVPRLRTRTRAVVKVQDGCDQFCSYCIVPFARSRKMSRGIDDVLLELRALAEYGYKEIVLTGIRLGSYDANGARLPELIRAASHIDGIERIRLSSIEAWEIDDALLDAIDSPKVCRHLHVPLQSGDDEVLRRMNRPYAMARFEQTIKRARERIPGIGITTDVIVGFPGESENAFQSTCDVVERIGFSRLHVFRYSPRERTSAASMPGQIDSKTKKRRSETLMELGRLSMRRFAESFVGTELPVLVERIVPLTPALSQGRGSPVPSPLGEGLGRRNPVPSPLGEGLGRRNPVPSPLGEGLGRRNPVPSPLGGGLGRGKILAGYADNYVEVIFEGDPSLVGKIVPVTVRSVDDAGIAECRLQIAD